MEISPQPAHPSAASAVRGSPEQAPTPTDPLGVPVPQEHAHVFTSVADFQEAKDLFAQLANLLHRIAQSPGGQLYRLDLIRTAENGQSLFACPALRVSLGKLQAAAPYCCYCPGCHAAHPGRANPRCKTCTGRGWTTRAAYESSPRTCRDAVLRLRSGNGK